MKRFSTVLMAVVIISTAAVAAAAERKVRLRVPDMVCASKGVAAVEAATSVPGVVSADDNPDTTILTVVYDDAKTSLDAIKEALKKGNYPVEGEPEFVK